MARVPFWKWYEELEGCAVTTSPALEGHPKTLNLRDGSQVVVRPLIRMEPALFPLYGWRRIS